MSRTALVALGALIAVVVICDRIAVRSSSSGAATLGLGVAMYRQHQYDDAVRDFDRAGKLLQAASDRARANFNLGNAYFALGELDAALESYKAALRLDPSDEDARYNLAIVTERLRNERPRRDTSMSRDGAEQLVSALGRPRVNGPGRSGPLPVRPVSGSGREPIDK
jgi:tetratricopeptide (TPR) repeat protein